MKPTNFFFLICIFFALVKVSVFEEEEEDSTNIIDFICLGVENYKADKAGISFKFLFMNLSNKPMTNSFGFNANITYLKLKIVLIQIALLKNIEIQSVQVKV